jgi:hypothetical protein
MGEDEEGVKVSPYLVVIEKRSEDCFVDVLKTFILSVEAIELQLLKLLDRQRMLYRHWGTRNGGLSFAKNSVGLISDTGSVHLERSLKLAKPMYVKRTAAIHIISRSLRC